MNLLVPDEFGLMKYVSVILGLINLLTVAGINTAVVQKKELAEGECGPLFVLNLLICLIMFAVTFASASLAARFFGEPELIALIQAGSSIVLIGGISTIHRALLQREFRYGTLAVIEAVSAVISSAVSITLAFKGYGAWALCWALVAFHVSSSLLCVAARRGVAPTLGGLTAALPLFWFGAGWTLIKLLDYLNTNLGNLLIGRVFGTGVLGAFTVAFEMISIPHIGFGLVLAPAALSAFSRMQDDGRRMKEGWLKLTFLTSSCVTVYCVILGLCAHDLIRTITMMRPDGTWDDAALFLRYLAPVIIVYSWGGNTGLLWAANRKIATGIAWTAAMLATMIAAIALGAAYGPLGVCAALIIRAAATFPILVYVMKKTSGIPPTEYLKALMPSVVCGGAAAVTCAGLTAALTDLFPVHHTVRLITCALLSTAVFITAQTLFFGKNVRTILEYLGRRRAS
jgi:PST family polysaccharide transporter